MKMTVESAISNPIPNPVEDWEVVESLSVYPDAIERVQKNCADKKLKLQEAEDMLDLQIAREIGQIADEKINITTRKLMIEPNIAEHKKATRDAKYELMLAEALFEKMKNKSLSIRKIAEMRLAEHYSLNDILQLRAPSDKKRPHDSSFKEKEVLADMKQRLETAKDREVPPPQSPDDF